MDLAATLLACARPPASPLGWADGTLASPLGLAVWVSSSVLDTARRKGLAWLAHSLCWIRGGVVMARAVVRIEWPTPLFRGWLIQYGVTIPSKKNLLFSHMFIDKLLWPSRRTSFAF